MERDHKQYDAIIVGGGPAGAACAYDLAQAGKSVLIIEKDEFPRFKPCAGMLTIKALHQLPYSIAPVVQWRTNDMHITRDFKAGKTLSASKDVVVTTVRTELDEFCLNKAIEAGAKLVVASKGFSEYETIEIEGKKYFQVKAKDKDQGELSFRADYLIGADGAHSKIRKQSAQFEPDRTAVALEGRVPLSRVSPEYQKLLQFDFQYARKGYGWLIPKGDHINVGIYTRRPDEYPLSKESLKQYTLKHLGTDEIDEMLGFPIGTGGEYFSPAKGKLLLVGDAAGLAEPIFGEGIHNGIKSGRAAAKSIIEAITKGEDAGAIYKFWLEAVRTDVWWCRQVARAYYKFIVPAMAVLKRRPVRSVVMEGFSDGLTIKECLKVLSPLHKAPRYPVSETYIELEKKQKSVE